MILEVTAAKTQSYLPLLFNGIIKKGMERGLYLVDNRFIFCDEIACNRSKLFQFKSFSVCDMSFHLLLLWFHEAI